MMMMKRVVCKKFSSKLKLRRDVCAEGDMQEANRRETGERDHEWKAMLVAEATLKRRGKSKHRWGKNQDHHHCHELQHFFILIQYPRDERPSSSRPEPHYTTPSHRGTRLGIPLPSYVDRDCGARESMKA